MTTRAGQYETVGRHGLTPRQQEVLALVARGRTNGEIALALGISLDGAKWHVGEILSKLGASSREEAALWYRQEQQLRRRLLRGLQAVVAAGAVKWAAGGVAALVAAGVGVAVIAALPGDDGASGAPAASGSPSPPPALSPSRTATPGTTVPPCTPAVFGGWAVQGATGSVVVAPLAASPAGPCRVGTVAVTIRDEASGQALVIAQNGDPHDVGLVLGADKTVVGPWVWRNWCGASGPFLISATVDGAAVRGESVNVAPRCDDSMQPSVLAFIDQPGEAQPSPSPGGSASPTTTAGATTALATATPAPPGTAGPGGGSAPPIAPTPTPTPAVAVRTPSPGSDGTAACGPTTVHLTLTAKASAGALVVTVGANPVSAACTLGGSLALTLVGSDGRALAVSPNPLALALGERLAAAAIVPVRWANWCGGSGPFAAVATLDGLTVATLDITSAPACDSPGAPSTLAQQPGLPSAGGVD